ncbi:AAA family ATPase [Lactobacillus plantarum]|nr:AAA family ATPase [Lactiplantibacillus plantarum]
MITKIKFQNFKSFQNTEIKLNSDRNILIGQNGVGKSTIIQAISLVLSGSLSQVSAVGLESLFNVTSIKAFMNSNREIKDLPKLSIQIFFSEDTEKDNYCLKGIHNYEGKDTFGLQLISEYNPEYIEEIRQTLSLGNSFPFEYYKVTFKTFSNKQYTSFNKPFHIKYDLVDTSKISTENSLNRFIKILFNTQTEEKNRNVIGHAFRELTDGFSSDLYNKYNLSNNSKYQLKINLSNNNDFSKEITAIKDNVDVRNIGKGEQVILGVKSSSASLSSKNNKGKHILLIEEPENHLSYNNMHRLIQIIEQTSSDRQTIIATHSDMIASRIDISKLILLNDSEENSIINLNEVDTDTISFFQKSPSNDFLAFVLSKRAILVEGNAEYITMEEFFKTINGKAPFELGVSIISCGGKSFKNYLNIATLLKKRVAVITDNDEDNRGEKSFVSVEDNYKDYSSYKNIKIFTDSSSEKYTFEVSLYKENSDFYKKKFATPQMSNGVLSYLLNNKSESALRLLKYYKSNNENTFNIPLYIKDAIEWIIK